MEHKKKKKRRKIILSNSFKQNIQSEISKYFSGLLQFFFKLSNIIRNCIFHFMY